MNSNDRVKIIGTTYNGEYGTVQATPSPYNSFYTIVMDNGITNFFRESELTLIGHNGTIKGEPSPWIYEPFRCECGHDSLPKSEQGKHSSWCPIKEKE